MTVEFLCRHVLWTCTLQQYLVPMIGLNVVSFLALVSIQWDTVGIGNIGLRLNSAGLVSEVCITCMDWVVQISGCGKEVCDSVNHFTICIYRPESACYNSRNTSCGNFGLNGSCAWRPTNELHQCIRKQQITG